VLGPVVHALASFDSINTSNERAVAMLQGKWKTAIADTGAVPLWVDVRDLARAHILAMEKPEAGGHRLFTTAGRMSNSEIAAIARDNFPEFADRLPGPDVKGGEPVATFAKIDTKETNQILGIKYMSLEKSITDLVKSLKEYGI
jgi:nucleoside-diphosphate-sugar epimerase